MVKGPAAASSFSQTSGEPLIAHARLISRDVEEIRDSVAEVFCPHQLKPVSSKPRLNARHHMVRLGQTGLNYLRYGDTVDIEPGQLEHFYLIQLPLHGCAEITCGQQYIISDSATASLLNPQDHTVMRWHTDNRQLLFWVPRNEMERRLTEHLGHSPTEPLRFDVALPQNTGLTQAWCRMLRDLAATIDQCGTDWLRFQATVGGLEDTLIRGLLQLHWHNYSQQLQQPVAPAAPRHLERAVEYLHDHLEDEISVADLARVACVSIRALEDGFRRHYQATPMQYARNLRLDRIRQILQHQRQPHQLSITQLAHQHGFIHLGRFSSYYKTRFGETPSQTLKRRLQTH